MMVDLRKYGPQLKLELMKQLERLDQMSFPDLQTIENFDISDEVLRGKPSNIRAKYNLPVDGSQVIYMMTLEGFPEDQSHFIEVIEGIGSVKSGFSHELTQITSINNKNFAHHKEGKNEIVVMYVGTSEKFASRVKTHAGYGSRDTATVCLRGWPVLKTNKIQFKFKYYDFGKEIAPETLKFLEFYLSKDLKPLIGHNRRS